MAFALVVARASMTIGQIHGHYMAYQQRLLLYCDILGWSAEIATGDPSKLLTAIECIHSRAEDYNEQERKRLLALDGEFIQTQIGRVGPVQINRAALEIQ